MQRLFIVVMKITFLLEKKSWSVRTMESGIVWHRVVLLNVSANHNCIVELRTYSICKSSSLNKVKLATHNEIRWPPLNPHFQENCHTFEKKTFLFIPLIVRLKVNMSFGRFIAYFFTFDYFHTFDLCNKSFIGCNYIHLLI